MNDVERLAYIKSLCKEQGADGDKLWLIERLEATNLCADCLSQEHAAALAQARREGMEALRDALRENAVEGAAPRSTDRIIWLED